MRGFFIALTLIQQSGISGKQLFFGDLMQMQTSEIGITIFGVAMIIFLIYFRYSEKSKPSLRKTRWDVLVSSSAFIAEMIGIYMHDKADAVMIVFGLVTLMFLIFSVQEFRKYRSPVKIVK